MPKKPVKRPVPVTALRTQANTQGANVINSVQTVRQVERRFKVMEMRRHGWSLHQIAETLGCTVTTASEDLKSVLGMTINEMMETTAEQRQIEIERYDALLRFYQPLAEAGNLAAAGLVLSISASRRKLCALDAPEQKAISETAIRVYVGVDVDAV
jgi:AraC-like DNA-binding protein